MDLANALREERKTAELQSLDKGFYQQVGSYLAGLEQELSDGAGQIEPIPVSQGNLSLFIDETSLRLDLSTTKFSTLKQADNHIAQWVQFLPFRKY
jgi:DNA replication initiation complex subunit (GINS family)